VEQAIEAPAESWARPLVKLSRINCVDGAERWRQWSVIEQARQDGFSQSNGAVSFELHEVQPGSALGPYQQEAVVGCYRFPDGLRPLLPAVNALLIAPPGDVVGLERAFELLCSSQVIAAIAHEHSGISTPRHRRYE
jgi:hypothetical protein